jgi:hypothetical protein
MTRNQLEPLLATGESGGPELKKSTGQATEGDV